MIDLPEVLEHLRAVVAAKGADYVYPESACVYSLDGKPACIVGHVYARLGLLHLVHRNTVAWEMFQDLISAEARSALETALQVQDGRGYDRTSRGTWGEALAAAEQVGYGTDTATGATAS